MIQSWCRCEWPSALWIWGLHSHPQNPSWRWCLRCWGTRWGRGGWLWRRSPCSGWNASLRTQCRSLGPGRRQRVFDLRRMSEKKDKSATALLYLSQVVSGSGPAVCIKPEPMNCSSGRGLACCTIMQHLEPAPETNFRETKETQSSRCHSSPKLQISPYLAPWCLEQWRQCL